jgi:hypothetical protein
MFGFANERAKQQYAKALADLEREAWRISQEGTREEIDRFSATSFTHSSLMSGRLKIRGRPPEYPVLPDGHAVEKLEVRKGRLLAFAYGIWHIVCGPARAG